MNKIEIEIYADDLSRAITKTYEIKQLEAVNGGVMLLLENNTNVFVFAKNMIIKEVV